MQVFVVILRVKTAAGGAVAVEIAHRVVLLAGEGEAPQAARVGRDERLVHLDDGKYPAQVAVHVLLDFGVVEGRFALRHHDAVVLQGAEDQAVEILLEQPDRRPDRVGGIDQDDIEGVLVVADVGEAVIDVQLDLRVAAVDGAGHGRQQLDRFLDDQAVDLAEDRLLDFRMLDDLADAAAVAAADHQHLFRRRMGEQGGMGDHVVIDEFVALGDHHQAVEEHHAAVVQRLDDVELLELALAGEQAPARLQGNADVFRVFFRVPEVHGVLRLAVSRKL